MTVFKATVAPVQSEACHHVRVALHVGESETSLQFSGLVVLRPEEVEEFLALVNGSAIERIRALCEKPYMREGVRDVYRVTPDEAFVKVSELQAILDTPVEET